MHLKIVTEVCAHAHKCTCVMYMPVCAFGGQRVVLGVISLAPFCFGAGSLTDMVLSKQAWLSGQVSQTALSACSVPLVLGL